ncbi:MAG: DUF1730 domain-containing protein [Elusimicrobiaceae bacterium]|nr:DUF1730 domain-containing protein [Elusimicrobiaceae bacterium]
MGNGRDLPQQIIDAALKYSSAAALVPAQPLEPELARLRACIAAGLPPGLEYLARRPRERADIRSWSAPAKTVLVMLFQYHNSALGQNTNTMPRARWEALKARRGAKPLPPPPPGDPVTIARYALSADYHATVKKLLKQTLAEIRAFAPKTAGRVFVDTSPVFEKALAVRAGLGFAGRNTLVIRPGHGSYFFIGGIALHTALEYAERPLPQQACGDCRLCETACPTGALRDGTINPARCLSYWTTAQTSAIPGDILALLNGRAQGCDLCQQACPYNKTVTAAVREEFLPLNP